MNRIFSNIISNALKYSDGDLSVTMTSNGDITFTNTAHNLTAVTVGRLFDRFYTVEASRNSTGLGLSIAKILIERMGGSIEAVYNNDKLQIKIFLQNKISPAVTRTRLTAGLTPLNGYICNSLWLVFLFSYIEIKQAVTIAVK